MTEPTNQFPATAPVSSQSRPARTWPLWILLSVTLAGVIALGLWSWQQWQNQQSLRQSVDHVAELNRQLENRLDQGVQERGSRLATLESQVREQQQQLSTQQRQIDHNASELLEAGHRTRTDWLLAEAEYLLRIANQRLLIEKDIRGALAALRSADQVLQETDDVGVYPVRQQLAREMLALRNVSKVDRTGLYLQLEAARESISELTDRALVDQQPSSESPAPSQDQPASDGNALSRAWQQVRTSLAGIISIRRLDQPAQPLLSPEQSAWARLNLQLMLEQAELAVLRGHPELYRQALDKATAALERWYDQSNNRVNTLRDTLNELKDRTIDPDLPDISRSLTLLKGRIAGRHANNEAAMTGDAPADGSSSGQDAPGDEQTGGGDT